MKIFHIVEEISKKNNSIVSITKTLIKHKKKSKSKIIIPNSNIYSDGANSDIKKVNILKEIYKFKSETYRFLDINKPDVIHVHGLWRPIHILFIISAKFLNIPIIVQPHGMLLNEAIKSSINTYVIKLLIIFMYKFLLREAIFIAVTPDEKKSIFKFFKTEKIYIIPNPFYSTYNVVKKLKKNIAFFGRFNPHKNIDLIIESFLEANLGNEWKLNIYGIDDDKKYKKKILKLINNLDRKKNIIIKKPIFNRKEKFKKISENYLNILMSKSEILSLIL